MERSKERENLMKMLYQMGSTNTFDEREFEMYVEGRMKGKCSAYFRDTYMNYIEHRAEIDDFIDKYSINWKVSRMPVVDLAIVRLAVTEIMFNADIPDSVAINEAVELAKLFGTDNSARFINGLLGKLVSAEKH